ncbi:MAG: exodeoxyribonuclease VII large subunit, partial [Candidatus Electrothrix sp. AR4]|nr:exodeoxyribonuclease VII large subunit [Candidatus Electrothrix sp. AR4]
RQHAAGRLAADGIVLCRGGGSIEDLQAFNDEELAREIHRSVVPVVSAVGHEIDVTIADLAADLRAPTPSGAAEMLLPDSAALAEHVSDQARRLRHSMLAKLDRYQDRTALYQQQLTGAVQPVDTLMLRVDHLTENMEHAMRTGLAARQTRLDRLENRLRQNNPLQVFALHQQKIRELRRRLRGIANRLISEKEQELARAAGVLEAVSPLSTLARGYAVARKKSGRQAVLTRTEQVRTGETIEVLLHRGRLECSVIKTE